MPNRSLGDTPGLPHQGSARQKLLSRFLFVASAVVGLTSCDKKEDHNLPPKSNNSENSQATLTAPTSVNIPPRYIQTSERIGEYEQEVQSVLLPEGKEMPINTSILQPEIDKFINRSELFQVTPRSALTREMFVFSVMSVYVHFDFVSKNLPLIVQRPTPNTTFSGSIYEVSQQKTQVRLQSPDLIEAYQKNFPLNPVIDCEITSAAYLPILLSENLNKKGNLEQCRLVSGIAINRSHNIFAGHAWVEVKERGGPWKIIDPSNPGTESTYQYIPYASQLFTIDANTRRPNPGVLKQMVDLPPTLSLERSALSKNK